MKESTNNKLLNIYAKMHPVKTKMDKMVSHWQNLTCVLLYCSLCTYNKTKLCECSNGFEGERHL